jgi:SAM-dependent methyltransferase
MPRIGELTYYNRIGQAGREHAVCKPFSDPSCGNSLLRVGALLKLLPAPPARVLECGCGTGWLAYFLAKRGFQVVATDVSPDAIQLALDNPTFIHGPVPDFRVADAERMDFDAEFDAVIFFDSLHHAVDELAALQCACRALKPGGMCVMLEPGRGHHCNSLEVEAKFEVTEKDMPPYYLRRLGKQAGFQSCKIYPAPDQVGRALYPTVGERPGWRWKLLTFGPLRFLATAAILLLGKRFYGITVLFKE